MSTHRHVSLLARLGQFADIVGSAVAVSSAIEGRRVPRAHDLKTLGIDPAAFRSIGRV